MIPLLFWGAPAHHSKPRASGDDPQDATVLMVLLM